jgi:predicted DNA-binding protein
MTTVQIPDEIAHQYEDRARAAGCDTETFIREALIAQLEDLEDVELALERLKNPQPSLSLEEVKRNLGLDD